MFLRMKRHATRSDSTVKQFDKRVPLDVAPRVKGRVISVDLPASRKDPASTVSFTLGTRAKVSLRTRDQDTADTRTLVILARLSQVFEAVRSGTVSLDQRQRDAFAGQVYHRLIDEHDANPGTPEQWESWKAFTRAALEGRITGAPPIILSGQTEEQAAATLIFGEDLTSGINALPRTHETEALEQRCGQLALWVLQENGIEIDSASHVELLRAIARAALLAGWQLKRQASGDWRPDPMAERFPPVEKPSQGTTLTAVFERWRAESKPAASTITTWTGVLASFRDHLKHEDVRRIKDTDVIAWKDRLVAAGKRPKTINDSHLTAIKAILNYAKRNRIITVNPADGVRAKAKKVAGEKRLAYEDSEVARLLDLASRETHPARRWLPWLAVFTGARIGELAQAWGNQVRVIDGIPALEIRPSPDQGSLKNEGSERTVPLHPALIDAGFLEFARKCGARPMFYGKPAKPGAEGRHPSKGTSNHLATWIREQGFNNSRQAPAHACRHWFKSVASRVGIPDSIADSIQGHTDESSAATYRHFDLKTLAKAIATIPVPVVASGSIHADDDGAMPALIRGQPTYDPGQGSER